MSESFRPSNLTTHQSCLESQLPLTRAVSSRRLCYTALLFSSLFFFSSSTTLAIDPWGSVRFVTQVWQTEQGLPQNSISAICQTRAGYLWLGTYNGLVRFDGVRFSNYEPGNSPGLAGNRITALMEDSSGNLWIGSESGLSVLKGGRFSSFTVHEGLPSNVIQTIAQDRQGTIWIGTQSGLARFDGDGIAPFNFNGMLSFVSKTFTYVDGDGVLWITCGGGLFTRGAADQPIHKVAAFSTDPVTSMCKSIDGDLWIGTADGLRCWMANTLEMYGKDQGLPGQVVLSVAEDHDGNLWIGTDSGLTCRREGRIKTFAAKDGLSSISVKCIAEGREGDLWIGTDGGGLDRWKHPRVTSYPQGEGLPATSIVPILQDRRGNIWVGGTCGGLSRLANGSVTTFTKRDGLPNECVWSLAEDRDGAIWLGTFNGGLSKFKDGRFVTYGENDGLPGKVVFALYFDRDANLWIGTDRGLALMKDGRITSFTVKDGLVHNDVKFITEDREGALWIATAGGVSRMKDFQFTNYTTADGLSYDSVRAIYQDNDGVLWIGTYGGGLNRLKGGKFFRYTTKEGLLDNTVSRILEDGHGNFWMSGNNGISRVSKTELNEFADGTRKSISVIMYGVADGMSSREANGGGQPAGCITGDGKMLFPTIRGLVSVDPNEDYGAPPPVAMESAVVNGKPIDLAGDNELGPGAIDIELHYTALSFQNPDRVLFKYMLEGFDKDWVAAGTRRTAYYTNLEPGSYRFRVIACNSEGVWNEVGTSIRLKLKPHFYRTRLFYTFSFLAVILGAYAVYRGRVRKLKARADELSALVEQRTKAEAALRESNRDLEEALDKLNKAQQQIIQKERLLALGQMASGVAHDFNNALAPILGYSELLLFSPAILDNREKVLEELNIINTAAKDAAKVVDRLRQFFRHRQDGESLAALDLNDTITQVITLTQPKWKNESWANGITINVKTDLQPVPAVLADEAELREALINLLFNAVDAMPAGGTILFRTIAKGDYVEVCISDTGIGMTEEVRRRCLEPFFTTKKERGTGLGLASVYGTIQRHRGSIEVESRQGMGATFRIRLPVRQSSVEIPKTPKEAVRAPNSLHVLLVDDEPQVRELLIQYLALDGHTVETAANGAEGLNKFRSGSFDLVVTDMAMPEMNGSQLCEAIEKLDPLTPVIMLTGFGEMLNPDEGAYRSTTLVLGKPVTISAFREAIARALVLAQIATRQKSGA